MNRKAKMLCAFALIFSCATSFAEENVSTETAKAGHHAAMGKAGATSPARAKQGPAKKTREAKAIVRKVTKEEMGKDAVCPVTGDKFKVTAETGSVSYKGKIYYFCCPACDKPFLENPEKYIDDFIRAGSTSISVHIENTKNLKTNAINRQNRPIGSTNNNFTF